MTVISNSRESEKLISIIVATTSSTYPVGLHLGAMLEKMVSESGISISKILFLSPDLLPDEIDRQVVSPDFGSRLKEALELVDTEYSLVSCDDIFVISNKAIFGQLIEGLERNTCDAIRINDWVNVSDYSASDKLYSEIVGDHTHAFDSHPMLVRTSSLKKIIQPGETLWEFERAAGIRCNKLGIIVRQLKSGQIKYIETIKRGKLNWFWAVLYKSRGVNVSNVPRMGILYSLAFLTRSQVKRLLYPFVYGNGSLLTRFKVSLGLRNRLF